jgi:Asp-tRNA(Asn)/Glu-tRNA(Gln) amidotransferase A subunit family amidase
MQASKLRLGIPWTPFFESLDSEIANAVAAAIEVLRKMTASVEDTALPSGSLPLDEIFAKVIGVETCTYHSQWLADSPEKYQAATRQRMISPPNAGGGLYAGSP